MHFSFTEQLKARLGSSDWNSLDRFRAAPPRPDAFRLSLAHPTPRRLLQVFSENPGLNNERSNRRLSRLSSMLLNVANSCVKLDSFRL